MFIQTEATPNPATLKFLPGRAVLETGTLDMPTREAAAQSPLAAKLFDVANVGAVFFGSDFIAVTKTGGEWQQLKPAILGAIMEHYMSGAPLLAGDAAPADAAADEFFDAKDAETVATIKDLIETRVRPAVAGDGGDITFRGYKEGIVYLNMKGACSGCPSSTATLRNGHSASSAARPDPALGVAIEYSAEGPTTCRLQRYRSRVYRTLVMFPRSAGPAEVDALIERIASSFKASAGGQSITRSVGSLMGPGAKAGEAGWILEADFTTLEDAMTALDADEFQDVKATTETLASTIFLFEVGEV